MAEDIMDFECRAMRIETGSGLKASSLRISFHDTMMPGKLPREGSKQQPYPATMSINYNIDQHGMISTRVKQWHSYVGVDQQLTNWTQDALNKKKILPGAGTVVNYQRQVRSWILETVLQVVLYQTSKIFNCILSIYLYTHRYLYTHIPHKEVLQQRQLQKNHN